MLDRKQLEAMKTSYLQGRDRLVALVNQAQGAADGVAAILALMDQEEQEAKDVPQWADKMLVTETENGSS